MASGGRTQPTGGGLVFDDLLDGLAHVQRRKLLVALLDHNPQDDTPVVIAPDEAADETVRRLVRMRHVHLPKLADYGFIGWNRETNEVSKGPNFEEIRPLIELLQTHGEDLPVEWL